MPAASPHEELVTAAITRLQALSSIAPANARVYKLASIEQTWAKNLQAPCLVVSGEGLERAIGADGCREAYAYPLVIRVVDCGNVEDAAKQATHQAWRYLIKRAFVRKRLSITLADNYDITYQDGPTIEPGHLEYDRIVRPIVFECECSEARP